VLSALEALADAERAAVHCLGLVQVAAALEDRGEVAERDRDLVAVATELPLEGCESLAEKLLGLPRPAEPVEDRGQRGAISRRVDMVSADRALADPTDRRAGPSAAA